jgi:endothelin-converting enzyme/putative endopeptidase
MNYRLSAALIVALGLSACGQQAESAKGDAQQASSVEPATAPPSATEVHKPLSGIDFEGMDQGVRVQDDLFDYANGKWVRETELPPDRARWGTFYELHEQSQEDIKTLVEAVSQAENVEAGSPKQKIRDFYNAFMDIDAATALGIEAIREELEEISAIESMDDVFRLFGTLSTYGINNPIGPSVYSDLKDPDTAVVYLSEAGITLPDRDYYLQDDEQFVRGRELYRSYVSRLFELAGMEDGATRAEALLALEHKLAEAHWTKEDNRDPVKAYNPVTPLELRELAPGIDWDITLEATQVAGRDRYIVTQPSYFEAASEVIPGTDLQTWKDYLAFQTINRFAPLLGEPFFQAWFDFYRAGLQGIDEPRPLWRRAVNATNGNLGELLGQLYVEEYFKQESKARMQSMIDNLLKAYGQSISELEWMGEETRQQALDKLSKFKTKIGYPDKWRDYSKLNIVAGDLVGNIKRSDVFETNRILDKLDKPVDKTEWGMTPQTVNAYYRPAWNEVVFPAAILQPPFFNPEADDAVNYGGIGAVIGHEVGHGFDDQGRKYDGDGNLRDWWTEEDNARFDQRKQMLAAQYNSYVVVDGLTINGEFTSGENIGDLGGLSIAYKAYQLSLDGQEAPVIDGLTGDQRFFLGWAQVWRGKARDEEAKRLLTVDSHSPVKFRANGAAVNVTEFYRAFDVQEGDGMWLPPEERVKIW